LPAAIPASNAKRKAAEDGGDASTENENAENDSAKRLKMQNGNPDHDTNASTAGNSNPEIAMQYARMVAAHVTFLDSESLLPPKMPTREEMEGVLLGLRKKALVEEYFGHDQG
jgi:pre-mRNA-splicing factor ISY1